MKFLSSMRLILYNWENNGNFMKYYFIVLLVQAHEVAHLFHKLF